MLAALLTSFTTFFATIGPIEAAVIFATLTPNAAAPERRMLAIRATAIASGILATSTLAGGPLLKQLGVSIPALQTAGGIILLMIAIEMVFARPSSAFRLTPPEGVEAQTKEDVAVFPLATPLLAGPGAMSAGILLAANAGGDAVHLSMTIAALTLVMALTFVLLLVAHRLTGFLGITAQRVLMRVFGIRIGVSPLWFLFLFLLIFGLSGYYQDVYPDDDTKAFVLAVVASLLFPASILLHELGHALAARREGIEVGGIELWLLGGLARMQAARNPRAVHERNAGRTMHGGFR